MLILKRIESFCASHRLFNPQLTEAENYRIYGKCANLYGHGHNYKLEVCVSGPIDKETGMIFNLQTLKEIIRTQILIDLDHKHLNFDVTWLVGQIPTTEVLVAAIWSRLQNYFTELKSSAQLISVSIWETEKNIVSYSVYPAFTNIG